MKKILFVIFIIGVTSIKSQTNIQNFLFDFGPLSTNTADGDITVSPDWHSNYWNNISGVTAGNNVAIPTGTNYPNLVNTVNQATTYALNFNSTTTFRTNGKVNGGLRSPYGIQFGADSVFDIATATVDYIFTQAATLPTAPSFKITGLNTSKTYRFKIFGCRNTNIARTSFFNLQGAGSVVSGTLNTSSVAGLGGTVYFPDGSTPTTSFDLAYKLTSQTGYTLAGTYYGNNNSVYTSDYITPNASGEITISVYSTSANAYAYINCMKMEECDVSGTIINTTSISIAGNDINSPNTTSQMTVVYTPTNATPQTITWLVDNSSIATINSNGVLTPLKNGTVTVRASFVQNGQSISATKQITITNQITTLFLSGTATPIGDNQPAALQMNATLGSNGNIVIGQYELATTLNASGTLKFFSSQTDVSAPVFGAGVSAGTILQNGVAITPVVSGPVLIRVYLPTNTYKIYPIDTLKISQMGSSVSYGTGATSNHGYVYNFNQLLKQRYNAAMGANWNISNISIGGNSTVNLLSRWDTDLLNDGAKYVVYAVSLGNEGIVGGGQPIYDQFKNNMLLLINKAKSVGKIPIVTNCYVRGDFTSVEYNFTKQIDLLIHQWDVASINLLGGIDDGTGKWPVSPINYQYDALHPNDAGHAELMYTIVPSLFDAIQDGKAQPQKKGNTYMTMGKAISTDLLNFTPDNTVHSFTSTFDIKTTMSGIISSFSNKSSTGTLRIEPSGAITYVSPLGGSVSGSTVVTDGQWHKITLTHYYAWGKTMLYIDNTLAGNVTEKLNPSTFTLNNANSPDNISYREWLFYRAGMNADEIAALNVGSMLKSSLELYSPLDGLNLISGDALVNLAQSTNKIKRAGATGLVLTENYNIGIYFNSNAKKLFLTGLNTDINFEYKLCDMQGRCIFKNESIRSNMIDVGNYSNGVYILSLKNKQTQQETKLKFIR